jgi:hypothetical protein
MMIEDFRDIFKKKKWLPISIISFLICIPILFYFQSINDHPVPKKISDQIINDIKIEDPDGKTLLTALPVYAIESNKELIYNNSRPTIYQLNDPNNLGKLGQPSYMGGSKNTVSTEDFIKEIDKQDTKLLLLDSRFGSTIGSNQTLSDYINLHYKFDKNYFSKPGYQINLYKRIQ